MKPILMLGWTWSQALDEAAEGMWTICLSTRIFTTPRGQQIIFAGEGVGAQINALTGREFAWIMLGPTRVDSHVLLIARSHCR